MLFIWKGVCLLWLLVTLVSSELKPLQGKVISGIYTEEVTRGIPYTKVAPMIFEFKLKQDVWKITTSSTSLNNNGFQILPRLSCRSDLPYSVLSTVDWYFTCPVFYHLHQYLQILRSNSTDIFPISPSFSTSQIPTRTVFSAPGSSFNVPSDNQKFSNSKIKFEDCDSELQKTWKGINARERDTGCSSYKGHVEKCSSIPMYSETRNTDDYTGYFDRMQSNFVSTFFLNSSDPGELVNNLLGLQSLHLQAVDFELTRIREALLSCQNNMIPQSFIKHSQLDNAMKELRPKLLKIQYATSTNSIAKLFRLPIADCIFTGTTLVVQVLLPVIRTDFTFTLLKANSPIFLYENRLCKVFPTKSGIIHNFISDNDPTEYHIFEKQSKTVWPTSCTPGDDSELCFIPDQASRPLINRCLTSIMNQSLLNVDDVRTYCTLECEGKPLPESFSKLLIPVIQRISSSKFVVAVNRITSLLIKCVGKPDEMVTPQEYGAVEISLACGCYLMWHSEKFEARVPCASTVFIRHVVPEQMLNRSEVVSARDKFFLMNSLGDRINGSLLESGGSNDYDDSIFEALYYNKSNTVKGSDFPIEKMLFRDSGSQKEKNYHTQSLSIVNESGREDNDSANGYSYYKSLLCYDSFTHTFLWIAVAVETMIFLGIAFYFHCRIQDMNKKWEMRDTSVTYSSAVQLTHAYD